NLDQLLPLVKPRMRLLSDYEKITEFLFTEVPHITEESFSSLNIEKELIIKILQFTVWSLDSIDDWTKDSIFSTVKIVADSTNLKLKRFLAPIFVSIAGTTSSISVMDSMCILGKSNSVTRINKSIELLGGITDQKYNDFLQEFNHSDSRSS
ncbi:MAG: glutamate--tRNA ligase, partial [Pseudomonadota bacterium]|nr:glutamate--tRNA ligase [Pseudomonadota bacterium]